MFPTAGFNQVLYGLTAGIFPREKTARSLRGNKRGQTVADGLLRSIPVSVVDFPVLDGSLNRLPIKQMLGRGREQYEEKRQNAATEIKKKCQAAGARRDVKAYQLAEIQS